MRADIEVLDQGTIVVLTPVSPEATVWFTENVGEPNWCGGYACDHRPARDLVEALDAEGFSFAGATFH